MSPRQRPPFLILQKKSNIILEEIWWKEKLMARSSESKVQEIVWSANKVFQTRNKMFISALNQVHSYELRELSKEWATH